VRLRAHAHLSQDINVECVSEEPTLCHDHTLPTARKRKRHRYRKVAHYEEEILSADLTGHTCHEAALLKKSLQQACHLSYNCHESSLMTSLQSSEVLVSDSHCRLHAECVNQLLSAATNLVPIRSLLLNGTYNLSSSLSNGHRGIQA